MCFQRKSSSKEANNINHINEASNEMVQVDFLIAKIDDQNSEILDTVDLGKRYVERFIPISRCAQIMKRKLYQGDHS